MDQVILGYPNYKVSTEGYVLSGKLDKPLKKRIQRGYNRVVLYKNKKPKTFKVSRLVAIAFIPNPNNLPEVNHKDLDKLNDRVENLEWIDKSGNIRHAYRGGAYPFPARAIQGSQRIKTN